MFSIIKVVLKSMFQKKGRSAMLIVSVMFSVGLIYSILSLSSMSDEIMQNQYKKEYGNSNVVMFKEDGTFIEDSLTVDESLYNYLIGSYNLYGYTYLDEDLTVNMYSYSYSDINEIYDIEYIENLNGELTGNQILIGETNSVKYGITIGDSITVNMLGESTEYIVYGIVKEGISFLDSNPNTLDIISSKDFIEDEFNLQNPNVYMMSLIDLNSIEDIQNGNPQIEVLDLYNQQDLITDLKQVTVPIAIMASSIVLISCYIIASTFKTIVIDRMSLIGTLRSIGATKNASRFVLILESVLYGLIGSILGIFIGVGILYALLNLFFGNGFSQGIEVSYINIPIILLTLISGILISVLSAYIPITKSVGYSIKDIIFGKIKNVKKFSMVNTVIGFVAFIAAYLVLKNVGTHDYMLFSLISIILSTLGTVLLIPLALKVLSPVVSFILFPIFKNNSVIASKNIKQDQTLINNIVLLTIGLGVIFMINSFSSDVGEAVDGIYGNANYDIIIYNENLTDDFISEIESIEEVNNVYVSPIKYDVKTNNGFDLMYLEGTDPAMYDEYGWGIFEGYLSDETINTFNNSNSIIITKFTAKKYELELGDNIEILNEDNVYQVEVISIVATIIQNGNVNYINHELFNEIYGDDSSSTTFIDVEGDSNIIKKEIKELYAFGVLEVITLEEMKQINEDNNQMLFVLMKAISVLAMLIGAIGIINNFIVSFISRRKLIASLRSLGLSQNGTVKLFMVESFITGLLGSTLGIMFGITLYFYMGFVVEGMNISSEVMTYSLSQMSFVFISGIVLSLLTSILPAVNMSKRNIVKEIKYE